MLNQTGFESKEAVSRKTILVDPKNSTAVPCIISDEGVTADSDGVKMVFAGTPLYGDLTIRDTAFTVTAKTTGAAPVGISHHDEDVTEGPSNGGVIIFGTVDISKLEPSVQTKVKAADFKMIQFVK